MTGVGLWRDCPLPAAAIQVTCEYRESKKKKKDNDDNEKEEEVEEEDINGLLLNQTEAFIQYTSKLPKLDLSILIYIKVS